MFKKLSASVTEGNRIVRFHCDQPVSQEIVNRIKKDSVLKTVITKVQRINNHTLEITASLIVTGEILDDLWSALPSSFDEWLRLELYAAMSPRRPKAVPHEKPPRGAFDPIDIGDFGNPRR